MSVNRFRPHVLVVPEDDANRELANGFHLYLDPLLTRRMQVLPEVGGWTHVRDRFVSDHITGMERYPQRLVVLLIDFDGDQNRLNDVRAVIPAHLSPRVFILGVLREPEDLKTAGLGTYEAIGSEMAKDCHDDTEVIWGHNLLRHNANELDRLCEYVRPMLFNIT